MSDVIAPKPHDPRKRPAAGCPTCGHTTNHDGHPVMQIACDTTAFERECAAAWLASTTGLPHDEAARIILDILLDLGWRPGGEG